MYLTCMMRRAKRYRWRYPSPRGHQQSGSLSSPRRRHWRTWGLVVASRGGYWGGDRGLARLTPRFWLEPAGKPGQLPSGVHLSSKSDACAWRPTRTHLQTGLRHYRWHIDLWFWGSLLPSRRTFIYHTFKPNLLYFNSFVRPVILSRFLLSINSTWYFPPRSCYRFRNKPQLSCELIAKKSCWQTVGMITLVHVITGGRDGVAQGSSR